MKKPLFYKKNSKLTNIFCGITIGKEAKCRKQFLFFIDEYHSKGRILRKYTFSGNSLNTWTTQFTDNKEKAFCEFIQEWEQNYLI